MLTFLAIALATFASEDLTCVATGLLIQRGQIGVTRRHPRLHAGDLCWRRGVVGHRPPFRQGSPGVAVGGSPAAASHAGRYARLARPPRGGRHRRKPIPARHTFRAVRHVWRPACACSRCSRCGPSSRRSCGRQRLCLLTATLGDAFVGRFTPLLGAGWTARLAVRGSRAWSASGRPDASDEASSCPPRGPRRSIASVGVLADVVVLRACDDLDCAARDLASWTDDNHGCESGNAGWRNGRRVQIRHPREASPRVHDSVGARAGRRG